MRTRKADMSRVCVKASPAFGRRRYGLFWLSRPFVTFTFFSFFFFILTFWMVKGASQNWLKSHLAQVELSPLVFAWPKSHLA